MGWDNRIFNVNGRGERMLAAAIALACSDGDHAHKIVASIVDPRYGFIFLWHTVNKSHVYPGAITPAQAADIATVWLESSESHNVPCEGWDADEYHDGSNSRGWRAYCGDWGHVGHIRPAIVAVKPAYLWHGK